MRLRLLAFASAADALGSGEVELELPDGTGSRELGTELVSRFPRLEPLWSRMAVAIDGEITRGDATLHDGAEVALLPPVSGG